MVKEPILNGTQSIISGNSTNGLFQSTNSDSFSLTGTRGKLNVKSLLPSGQKIYKFGGDVQTTLTAPINNTDGASYGGPKVDISVASSAEFPDAPVVVINPTRPEGGEVFMCDGKAPGKLTGCIRGLRYWRHNTCIIGSTGRCTGEDGSAGGIAHVIGETVVQDYSHLYREVDTGHGIDHPYDFGANHADNYKNGHYDEMGNWGIWIENTASENDTNFLNVYSPSTNLSAAMPDTQLITSTTNNMKGALINDPINPRIVMFSPTTAQVSDTTYVATYSSGLIGKHLITGLVPSSSFDIYKNGTKLFTKNSSNQGVLSFDSLGGSTFQLVKSGTVIPACANRSLVSSSVSPTSIAIGGSYTVSCDYGVTTNAINPVVGSGSCVFQSFSGTAARFNCTAGSTIGTFSNSCVLSNTAPDYYCARTDPIASLTVSSAKFQIGDKIQVISVSVNVRATPSLSGTILGSQLIGIQGTIIQGPTIADGYTWWSINYDTGVDGWSVENNIDLLSLVSGVIFTPTLEGISSINGRNFTITINNAATSIQQAQFTALGNASNQVILPSTITNLREDRYNIYVKSAGYLKAKTVDTRIASSATVPLPVLKAGDLNDDGIINSLDWSLMNSNWFTNNITSDINKDGIVNTIDFSWMNKNWLQTDAI